ncbi:DUF4347 domain-containing protein [filamentous cyanobacterium LEGE 11480]|uniref:DUF4347 domain-containing protein n=1 Tax=Romeriopsis navalis LEGE 11480 TaxID=2777977 RepID=A0A928VPX5_9CYAN|nr:DUF4347 domain-containing protein [Romeriopsis navalis]MBE9030746.1 DUF4347 domain-containing protein [Romeriopsis navalis LEGE 11480]
MNSSSLFTATSSPLDTRTASGLTQGELAVNNWSSAEWEHQSHASTSRSLLFIDGRVDDHQTLVAGVKTGTEVFVIDPLDDAINQITNILLTREGIADIQIVSHGEQGGLLLGNNLIDQDYLGQHAETIAQWSDALMADADILLYGCDVAGGAIGEAFIEELARLTGADIAASSDRTGNAELGGDWELEIQTGGIEAKTITVDRSFDQVLSTISLDAAGKLSFAEGLNIVNNLGLSVIGSALQITEKATLGTLTAGSGVTSVASNIVSVALSAIKSIELKLGFGKDTVSFDSDITFANGQLSSFIIEGEENTLPGIDLVAGDLIGDSVNFNNNLFLGGANLNVSTENITVASGKTLSTRQVAGGANHLTANSIGDSGQLYFTGVNPIDVTAALGNIQSVKNIDIGSGAQLLTQVESGSSFSASDLWLNARFFSNADFDNLFPVTAPDDWAAKTATINLGANAALRGNNIIIKAQAEDKNFTELVGSGALLNNFVIGPLQERLLEAVALPVKVLVRKSKASVDVNTGVSLVGLAGVSVEAVATTDSTGIAKGSIASVGYAHAEAEAKVDLLGNASITAGEAVKIGSEGNAKASITTETEGTNSTSAGMSFAVDYAKIVSQATVAENVVITAGKTANIVALGNKETEANATSTTGQSGKTSLAFGVNISDADIKADVNGTITANQNPGAIVKLELDPLKEVTYEFNPTSANAINTANNTIDFTGVSHALRSGDKIKYTTQAGNTIGGISSGTSYYAVVDPNNANLIRLAANRADALAIDAALKTTDTSDDGVITSKTIDLTSIGTLGNSSFANTSVNATLDTITFGTSSQLKIGQAVVYRNTSGSGLAGLVDGQTYYVITYSNTASDQTIQLATTESNARQGIAIDIAGGSGNHSLSPLHQFTAAVTDTTTDSIDLAKVFGINDAGVTPHALATGDQVSYSNRRGTSIGGLALASGLTDGQDYFIVTDPNNPNIIRLATSELKALEAYSKLENNPEADLTGLIVDFNPGANEPVAAVNSKSFDATKATVVDNAANTIVLSNDAFSGSGTDFSLLGSTFELGQAVIYNSNGGRPIGGLEDGKMYYVVAATDENNLDGDNRFVKQQLIGLADTENKARAGILLDIDPAQATGTTHSLTATHVIDSGLATGIGILAQLTSSDKSVGTSEMKKDADDTSGTAEFDIFDKAGKIFSKLVNSSNNGNYSDNSNAGGNNSGGSALALGAALGFNYTNHDVLANVGSPAVLKSKEDLEVQGTIEHTITLNADSDADTTANNSVSAAVIVGIQNNTADAIVNSNAQLDAYKATRVIAETKYPYLTRPDEFIPANLGELVDLTKTDGYDTVNNYLDGTLGLKSKLINTWARSTASGNNIGIAGAINVQIFNNNVNAIVKPNALINQDLTWRSQSQDQSISVEATNYMQLVNVTGVFQFKLPSLEVGLGTGTASKADIKLLGADGKGGIGGAFFLMFLNNNTNALVDTGAKLFNGAKGGFNMKAEEAIMNFSFAQSGAEGSKYGVAGTFSYINQNSNTVARLAGGTTVEGRSATIYAGSLETHINWSGGVAKGNNLGFGITVSINDINRNTFATIGNYDGSTPAPTLPASTTTNINLTEGLQVNAKSDGWLGAFSLAAAIVSKNPQTSTGSADDAGDDPLEGESQPDVVGSGSGKTGGTSNDQGNQGKTGIAIAGDVSINTVKDDVRAYFYDAGILTANTVDIQAENATDVIVASGAAAFVASDPSKQNSAGIAGSLSLNTLTGKTQAIISGADQLRLTANNLAVDAKRKGSLFALSAGGAAAPSKNGIAIAGSVSVNRITNTTQAYIERSKVTTANVALNATDESKIFAIGGALSFGGKGGFGAAIGVNQITNTTEALLRNNTLDYTGQLNVAALTSSEIKAFAASVGISTAQNGIGAAGTVSANKLALTTTASIENTNRTTTQPLPTGGMTVSAKNTADIQALAGAVGGGGSAGLGAAVTYNKITNNTRALVNGSTLATQGTVNITAETSGLIKGLTLGVGGGKNLGFGGSVAINLIRGETKALIGTGSNISATGNITVKATTNSTIEAFSGGIAGSAKAAIGAAVSVNDITTQNLSQINGATVTSTAGSVSLFSQNSSTISGLTVGGAGAGKMAIGGSVSVNEIGNTVESSINTGAVVTAAQNIDVTAIEASTIKAKGGALAGAGTAAVAGAVVVNDIATKVNAKITGSTANATQGSVTVSADSQDNIETISVGGAGGGTAGVAGSVSVSMMNNEITAEINASTVTADDNVRVLANSKNTIDFYGGTISGGGTAGIGGSANVNTIANKTHAKITGNSNVSAKGNATSSAPKADGSGTNETIQGIAVVATSDEDVNVWTANISGGGTAGVAATASVNVLKDETLAYIDGGTINGTNTGANANQAVRVRALNNSNIDVKAGAATFGGTAGVGATVDVTDISNTTKAYINGATTVNAQSAVDVTSFSRETFSSIVASGAGGGTVGIAGSVLVTNLKSTNQAYINGSTVNSNGTLRILADDQVSATAKAGAVGIGVSGGGVGGTVSVINIDNSTTANITSSITNATGLTEVKANTTETVSSLGGTVAGGLYVGAAGTVLVSSITSKTLAYIDGTSQINNNAAYQTGIQDVSIDAQNRASLTGGVASLGAGAVGFGASVMVSGIWNTTSAYVGDGVAIKTGRDLKVNAFSDKTVTPTVLAFAGGLGAVAGAVSVVNVGGGMSSDGTSAVKNSENQTNAQTNKSQVGDQLGNTTYGSRAKAQADDSTEGLNVSGSFGSTAPVVNGTTAFIGINANITTTRNLDIKADERTTVNQIVGRLQGGAVSVGGSVAIANVTGNTQAFIGGGTIVTSGGNVNINADYTGNQTGFSAAGSGGLVSLGAQVVLLNDNSNQSAYIGNAAQIRQANNIAVNANANRSLSTTMADVAVGGVVAGAAISRIVANGATRAYVDSNAQIGQFTGLNVGNLNVSANSNTTASGIARALSVGIAAGSGNDAKATVSPTVAATVGNGADIKTTGSINLTSNGTAAVNTNVLGVNAGAAAIGVSLSEAKATPTLTTSVGSDAVLNAGQSIGLDNRFNINANGTTQTSKKVTASATSSGGGLLSGNGADAKATTNPTLSSSIGDRSQLTAGQDISVQARSTSNTEATGSGNSYGAVAVGVSLATANETVNVQTTIGTSATLTGRNLTIKAEHQGQQVKARATSSTGGLVGGVGANATAKTNTTVKAQTGASSILGATGNFTLNSTSSNVVDASSSGKAFGVAAGGQTSATAEIINNNTASTGASSQITAGNNATVTAQSTNRVARAEAVGGTGGLFAGASTSGTAKITDNTTATVGNSGRITATGGTVTVESLVSNEAHSKGSISTGGAITSNVTESRSDVTSQVRTNIGTNANLRGKQIKVHSKITKLAIDADAYSKTIAASSTTNAKSFVNINANTKVTNFTGANLNSDDRVEVISRLDGVSTNSKAKGEIQAGVTGSVFATAHNNLTMNADIDVQANSQISGTDVFLEAYSPKDQQSLYGVDPETAAKTVVKYITETIRTVSKAVSWIPFVGSIVKEIVKWVTRTIEQVLNSETEARRSGSFSSNNKINLGGDIYQGSPATAKLTVNPNLTIVSEGNVSAQIVGNEVIVSNLIASPTGSLTINSYGGDVTGNVTVHKNSVLNDVQLINNSTKDFRINQIQTINRSGTSSDLELNAENSAGSTINFVTDVTGDPTIDIRNSTASDIIFAGAINNATGVMSVLNQGGNIITTGAQLENKSVTLAATVGNVGTTTNRLNLRLYDTNTENAALSATVGQNLYLNTQLVGSEIQLAPVTLTGLDFNNITAGQNIDITVQAAEVPLFANNVVSPSASDGIYNLKNLSSTQGNVAVAFLRGTTVNIGQLSALSGTVSLNTVGSLVDNNTTGADIVAQAAILQATVNTGAANNALETQVGKLEGSGGNLWLNNTGNLAVGGISSLIGLSMTGQANITNAGSITVNENVTATGAVSFTATDTTNNGEDVEVADNAKVESTGDAVTLLAGDNLTVNASGTVKASTKITLKGDHGNADTIGSTIDLRGTLNAPTIEVTGNNDADTVSLTNVTTNAPVKIQTQAGNDTIRIGSQATPTTNTGGTVNQINGNLEIDGGTGTDQLIVDETGDNTNNTGNLTQNTITGLGMTGSIQYAALETVDVNLGAGADNLTIASTHANTTNVNTNGGQDTVNIQTIAGTTTVNTGSENDTINVGDTSQTTSQISAQLNIVGGTGSDQLNVNDTGTTTNRTGNLTANQVTGLGMSNSINYSELETVDVNLGAGNDSFTVASTHANTSNINSNGGQDAINIQSIAGTTTVKTGSENDIINVANTSQTVNQISAQLNVEGGTGSDQLIVNDTDDTSANTGNLTANQVTGLGMSNGINYSELETVDVNLGSGDDNFTVESTHANATNINSNAGQDTINVQTISGTTTVKTGTENDIINVADTSQTVNQISAQLNVEGGTGSDTINIDDSGDTIANNGNLTANQVTGLGMSDGINYSELETVNVNLGSNNDTFTIESTHANATNINGNAGQDIVNVQTISGTTTVKTGADNDTINVADTSQTVNQISAQLNVEGGTGSDTIDVDDTGDTSNNTGNLTTNQVTGLGMSDGIQYSELETVNINLGSGDETFTVESTHANATNINGNGGQDTVNIQTIAGVTTVKTGTDNDTINVANTSQTVNQISAQLNIEGGAGTDVMNINDSGDTTDNVGNLTATQVTGLGMSDGVNYGELETVNVNLGTGSDTFTVESTHTNVTNINGNEGNDTVNVQTISGTTTVKSDGGNDIINVASTAQTVNQISAQLNVEGGIGNDTMNVDDAGDTTNNTGNLTSNQLTGLGMSDGIQYSELETVNLDLGTGNDTFTIESTHANVTNLNANDGQDTINVQTISGTTTVKADAGDDIINVHNTSNTVNQISAQLNVEGGTGNDQMLVDDSGDTTNNTGKSTTDTVTGLGMSDGINYIELETLDINLGSGNDSFTIESTHTNVTNLNGNAGQDNITVQSIAGPTTVNAGDDNDTVTVTTTTANSSGTLVVNGDAGDDIIDGSTASLNLILNGDTGNDNIQGGSGDDQIGGGANDDTIDGNAGKDEIRGDSSFQRTASVVTAPVSEANPGNDIIQGGAGEDTIYAEAGNDVVIGGSTNASDSDTTDFIYGGAGDDTIAGDNATINPTTREISNLGTQGAADFIFGDSGTVTKDVNGIVTQADSASAVGDGNDVIAGGVGDDAAFGGQGKDNLAGNQGKDKLFGDHGKVTFQAGVVTQVESIDGSVGDDDTLQGNEDDDVLIGGAANDTINGNQGKDIALGDNGIASFVGGLLQRVATILPGIGGKDTIAGDEEADIVLGGADNDIITGGSDVANDILLGDHGVVVRADGSAQANDIIATDPTEGGQDTIAGGAGNDIIIGGTGGNDTTGVGGDQLQGDAGDDIVVGDNATITRDATDTVEAIQTSDVNQGGDDTIAGGTEDDILIGGFGNDGIQGNAGQDIILGDNATITMPSGTIARIETSEPLHGGNDTLSGEADQDFILGGAGNDTIDGGAADDIIIGDHGTIVRNDGSPEANDIFSTAPTHGGQDNITAGLGDDIVLGGADNDTITGNEGKDTLLGDHGYIRRDASDVIERIESRFVENGGDDTIQGNAESDQIIGGSGADTIDAGDANDIVLGDNGTVVRNDGSLEANDIFSTDPTNGGKDNIVAGLGDDTVLGGTDNDIITGNAGADTLLGDNGYIQRDSSDVIERIESRFVENGGDDTIQGNADADQIIGGSGADTIDAGDANDIVLGDNGTVVRNDGSPEANDIFSTDPTNGGQDNITAGLGDDIVLGGTDNDTITGNAGQDTLFGDHGYIRRDASDVIERIESRFVENGGDDTIQGNTETDQIIGGSGADTIDAGDANDIVLGDNGTVVRNDGSAEANDIFSTDPTNGGKDNIIAGLGNDTVLGGTDDDTITGNAGTDTILGDHGKITRNSSDVIERIATQFETNGGNDTITGNEDADTIMGGSGNDTIDGGAAADIILGDNGISVRADGSAQANDIISTETQVGGQDNITAGDGDDIVLGGGDNDTITGNAGQDILFGDHATITRNAVDAVEQVESTFNAIGGDDNITGNEDADWIVGGAANDTLAGNAGADRILGDNGRITITNGAVDTITTTTPTVGGQDRITGDAGDDAILGGTDNDNIIAGQGNDVVLGDNGELRYLVDADATTLDIAVTTDFTTGGDDTIQGNDGKDIILGGAANDNILGGANNDTIAGDNGQVSLTNNQARLLESLAPGEGGTDTIAGGDGNDAILGGFGGDVLSGNSGDDAILGDNGRFDYAFDGNDGENLVAADSDLNTIDFFRTTDPTLGGDDRILGGFGNDRLLGGSGNDTIAGEELIGQFNPVTNEIDFSSADDVLKINSNWIVAGRGDFNGDQQSDILWRDQTTGATKLWFMQGTELLGASYLNAVPLSWQIADIGDLNGDGKMDLFWRSLQGENAVWLMDGSQILETGYLPTAPADWQLAALRDLNNDGKADVLWRNAAGQNAVWIMDGTAITDSGLLPNAPTNWSISAVADFNNDGRADIFWHTADGQNAVWLLNGKQLVDGGFLIPTNANWSIAAVADFNNDGNQDILWRGTNGQNAVWLMNGKQLLAGAFLPDIPTNWSIVDAKDLNGDNKSDIIWRSNTGESAVWLMDGTQVALGAFLANIPNSWIIESVADFDQDGKADIFWRNVDGLTAVWKMDGAQIAQTKLIQTDAGNNDVILGDHGKVYTALPQDRNAFSIDTAANQGGGNDNLFGNEGYDTILGGQDNDLIHGGSGQDDLYGGHNVAGGADGNDFIEGGDAADVVIGDNGLIRRRWDINGIAAIYPQPFGVVIRDVVRFDDIDGISGNDFLRGDAGDDILYGQRGDDTIEGNAGDDELIGHLGNDTLRGGDGNDTLLGDVGTIVRATNADGSPRRNLDGSWHRDILLTDVAKLNAAITAATDLATQDYLLLADDGSRLGVTLAADGNDNLDGGSGNDQLFGQRGNDRIEGGSGNDYLEGNSGNDWLTDIAGDDFIVGDDNSYLPPFDSNLPTINRGIHIIEQAAGLDFDLGRYGTVVTANLKLTPQAVSNILPTVALAPELAPVQLQDDQSFAPIIRSLQTSGGNSLNILGIVIPDLVNHLDLLAGNDTISAGSGIDYVIGDNYSSTVPVRTGIAAVDDALDVLTRSLYHLNYDLHDLELAQTGSSNRPAQTITIGQDLIDGGDDRDHIIGDDGTFLAPLAVRQPSDVSAIATVISQLQNNITQFNAQLTQFLAPYASGVMNQPITLAMGNDTITGGNGDDKIFADDTLTLVPTLDAPNYVRGSSWSYQLIGPERQARSNIREFDLQLSNDNVSSGAGNDLIIGGDANLIMPLVADPLTAPSQQNQLKRDLDLLLEDTREFLRDLHNTNHGINYAIRDQSNSLIAQNDTLNGESGNDVIMGDNTTLSLPLLQQQINVSLELLRGNLDFSNEAHNFFHGLAHTYDVIYRNPQVGFTRLAEDTIVGNDGNDVVFGSRGVDQITGDQGDDFIFGGEERDVLSGGTGSNVVRTSSPSSGDQFRIETAIDFTLFNLLSPTLQQYIAEVSQAQSSATLSGELEINFPG